MTSLEIYAGPVALKRLQSEGFKADQFNLLVGASGGPKWFVLLGLDRYLFGEFFAGRKKELLTLGSSVGAWRMCCMATNDPVASVERLAKYYCHEHYSSSPTVEEVTTSAKIMLGKVLAENGIQEIVKNPIFRTNVVSVKARGIGSSRAKVLQAMHLGLSALGNLIARRALALFYERIIFTCSHASLLEKCSNNMRTKVCSLSLDNLADALLSSGSIPFVLDGVRNISGAGDGLYWDGGIVDYHFDWPFYEIDNLVLYPHFSSQIIPGWFDKRLPWRRVNEDYLSNVVMLAPSKDFVHSLPGGKIPDRRDFTSFPFKERVKIWEEVIRRSESLAAELKEIVNQGKNLHLIRPISERER
ncbi:MAG: patatin-like phospholipase family protein [Gammaproteobacteria bacterium]|nr:patatin-like phospholipase family protein [Gammaproteobacteria bacterium]